MRLALCLPVAVWLLTGCHLTPKAQAAVATIATVQSVDAGIDVFVKWDAVEEHNIAAAAIDACHGLHSPSEYDACTRSVVEPRRAPIDRAKVAVRLYREALSAGTDPTLPALAAAVVRALADLGIRVTP